MMIFALILTPFFAGLFALLLRHDKSRRLLLVLTALAHTVLTLTAWLKPPAPVLRQWLFLDPLGLLFLTVTSILSLASSVYALDYLRQEPSVKQEDLEGEFLFVNAPEARFTGCLLFFLSAMTLVCTSSHFGILWVAIEMTTLTSAPLIYFHRHPRSLEATWKYLLICSVGIAVALLANFFLAVAVSVDSGHAVPLVLADLLKNAETMNPRWLQAAFLCFIVGYGTKMGLAPMHTWLPDAHSESPSLVSALLSGALLNCAFLGILRIYQVSQAAGQKVFCENILIGFGLLSMLVAMIFIVGQFDYKRLLAYSSVEHMGILSLGVGLGGIGTWGAIFHAVNHSLTKAMLFLAAGQVLHLYKTKQITKVKGILQTSPAVGFLWLAGFFAITGSPPFGTFMSEFLILKAAISSGRWMIGAIYLIFLAVIFVAMAFLMLPMAQGISSLPGGKDAAKKVSLFSIVPPLLLGFMVFLLGFYLPPVLKLIIDQASQGLGVF